MNKPKHTPGPWRTGAYTNTNKCFVATKDGSVIFEQITGDSHAISPDARLIAASPEMLSGIETILFAVTDDLRVNGTVDATAVQEICETLIAKATGEK